MRTQLMVCGISCIALLSPLFVTAATVEELQEQIRLTQTLITQLSSQQPQNLVTSTSFSSCPALSRTLTRDMNGNDVQQLQQFLIGRGLLTADSATGFFGPLTEAAVQQFQCISGIACSGDPGYGTVGPRTRSAIALQCTQSASPIVPGSKAITGWAWGGEDENADGSPDTGIGWVALHCSVTTAGCTSPAGTWGLTLAPDGTISGHAWSPHIGWIGLAADSCPRTPCLPKVGANGAFSGWLKALSVGGGWDGWISLGDTNPTDTAHYGVTLNGSTISGYAWGGDVVGWLRFTGTTAPLPVQ